MIFPDWGMAPDTAPEETLPLFREWAVDWENESFALRRGELDTGGLELSAVSELRVTEKGIEVKLVDRVRALEALWKLLDTGEPQGSDPLYQALTALGQEQENAHGE